MEDDNEFVDYEEEENENESGNNVDNEADRFNPPPTQPDNRTITHSSSISKSTDDDNETDILIDHYEPIDNPKLDYGYARLAIDESLVTYSFDTSSCNLSAL